MKKLVFLFSLLTIVGFACTQQNKSTTVEENSEEIDSLLIEKGDSIIRIVSENLRSELMDAIRNYGMDSALSYCNIKAIPITEQLNNDEITISRMAERYRNPENKLADYAQDIFEYYRNNTNPEASLIAGIDGTVYYVKPIYLAALCANCHGHSGVQIADNVQEKINKLYPNDLAINFNPGELRGLWHIEFRPTE
jgi:hypothetical protein